MKEHPAIDLIWQLAIREAVAGRHELIEPAHFLEALTKGRDLCRADVMREAQAHGLDTPAMAHELSLVPELLEAAGIDPTALRRAMRAMLGAGGHEHPKAALVHRSESTRAAFASAGQIDSSCGLPHLHPGALFAALIEQKGSPVVKALEQKGADIVALASQIRARLGQPRPVGDKKPAGPGDSERPDGRSILERFGRDLTKAARDGLLSPVIGRRKEMLQVIQTLARKTKSNPVLAGEAGVGKTAIVEGIAQRIADGKDAQVLGGKRIVEISVSSLVAGTKYRGEFEERVKQMLAEAKADPQMILFIDEIHTMIGAGGRQAVWTRPT